MILYVTRRPGNKGNNLLSEDLGVNSVEGEERDLEKAVQDAVLNAYPQIKETTDISEKSDDSFNTFFGSVPLAANTEQPSRIIQDQQFIADEEQAPTKFDEVTPSAEQDIADLNQEPKHERSQSAAKSQDIMGTEDSRNANESSQQKTNTMTDQNNYMRAAHIYHPRMADEIELAPGDILYLIRSYDDGWAKAYNVRTGKEGIFPLSFAKKAKSSSKVST
jgi:hypothetical protein